MSVHPHFQRIQNLKTANWAKKNFAANLTKKNLAASQKIFFLPLVGGKGGSGEKNARLDI